MSIMLESSSLVDVPDDLDEFNAWAIERRWSDGLPLIPPTPERVARMLTGTDFDPETVIAKIPARQAKATVQAIAINAVMAGCQPSAMPILIAMVEATEDPALNMYGCQATTHPCALMVMVTGDVAKHAGVHSGAGLFGSTFPANVTIGRATRLIQQNIGGAFPGESDRSTQGTSAKISFCWAENQDDSPWEPYRVSRGFAESDSTISLVFAEGPHNIDDHVSKEPRGLAFTMASTIATTGNNNAYCRDNDYTIAVCPEHAIILAKAGWKRSDLQEYLHERARIPFKYWRLGGLYKLNPQEKYLDAGDDDMQVRITKSADDIHIVVAGGHGLHSAFIPTFGLTRMTTRVVRSASGEPWRAGASA
jgi:hypothetical protein